jgi:hypothetical protein
VVGRAGVQRSTSRQADTSSSRPSYGFAIVGCTMLTVYKKPTCTSCRKLRALLARPIELVLELL